MIKRLSLVVLLILVLSACRPATPEPTEAPTELARPTSTNTPTPKPTATTVPPTNTPAPTATEAPKAYGPEDFPSNVNPLTGKIVEDPDLLERRPLAVKIQMYPRGQRPPWGISLADIVFDYYQNNGLSRLNAIFYGNNAEQVGPIRSARLFDGYIVRMYKAVFAFGGADQRILNKLYAAEYADRLIVEGASNCPPMCRVDPNSYNFLVTNIEELSEYATEKKIENERQDLDGMRFDPETPDGGEDGDTVFMRYSIGAYTRWDYDPDSGRYLRFQDAQEDEGTGERFTPLMDRLTEEQVAADNVVVLLVTHEFTVRAGGSEIVDILLNNTGVAYAFRDGQMYKLVWNRPDNTSLVTLTFEDGTLYPMKPGTTWFTVLGQASKTEQQDDGAWRFEFRTP